MHSCSAQFANPAYLCIYQFISLAISPALLPVAECWSIHKNATSAAKCHVLQLTSVKAAADGCSINKVSSTQRTRQPRLHVHQKYRSR